MFQRPGLEKYVRGLVMKYVRGLLVKKKNIGTVLVMQICTALSVAEKKNPGALYANLPVAVIDVFWKFPSRCH